MISTRLRGWLAMPVILDRLVAGSLVWDARMGAVCPKRAYELGRVIATVAEQPLRLELDRVDHRHLRLSRAAAKPSIICLYTHLSPGRFQLRQSVLSGS